MAVISSGSVIVGLSVALVSALALFALEHKRVNEYQDMLEQCQSKLPIPQERKIVTEQEVATKLAELGYDSTQENINLYMHQMHMFSEIQESTTEQDILAFVEGHAYS